MRNQPLDRRAIIFRACRRGRLLNGLDLFTGIGGITLALREWVWPLLYCEIDRYAQAVLVSRIGEGQLPDAPIFSDVRKLDGLPLRGLVDIISGGFPCQDLSVAGLGKGLEGERSGLFFEIVRLAKEVRPRFIFLENVPAIRTRGASLVCKELASCGYDLRWTTISAFDVGAPHKRERWFLLAHAKGNGDPRDSRELPSQDGSFKRSKDKYKKDDIEFRCGGTAADSDRESIRTKQIKKSRSPDQAESRNDGEQKPLADSDSDGRRSESWSEQTRRHETHNGGWWQVEPDVGRVVDELPYRVDRIKCLGNAVVPLQVKTAFKELIGMV